MHASKVERVPHLPGSQFVCFSEKKKKKKNKKKTTTTMKTFKYITVWMPKWRQKFKSIKNILYQCSTLHQQHLMLQHR